MSLTLEEANRIIRGALAKAQGSASRSAPRFATAAAG